MANRICDYCGEEEENANGHLCLRMMRDRDPEEFQVLADRILAMLEEDK